MTGNGDAGATAYIDADLLEPDMLERLRDSWSGKIQQQMTWCDREQVARFFTGTDLVEPGLVPVEDWRPGRAVWAASG